MVVDDEPFNIKCFRHILKHFGYDSDIAYNGQEAFQNLIGITSQAILDRQRNNSDVSLPLQYDLQNIWQKIPRTHLLQKAHASTWQHMLEWARRYEHVLAYVCISRRPPSRLTPNRD